MAIVVSVIAAPVIPPIIVVFVFLTVPLVDAAMPSWRLGQAVLSDRTSPVQLYDR